MLAVSRLVRRSKRCSLGLRSRRAVTGALAAVAMMVLGGCSGHSGGSAEPSGTRALPSAGETKRGGTVTMLTTGLSARFDPVSALAFGFVSNSPMNAIYGLLSYNESATNTIKMGFLKALAPDPQSRVWTAKLTPGLKFSDGTPFDAAAIAFNLKRAADPGTGSLFLKDAKSITTEVIDPTTLKMTLRAPNVHFDAVMTEDFPYVGSPTAIQREGENFGTAPVGAGPFKVKNIDGTNSMELVRSPYYELFAPDQPRLDSIKFQVVSDFSKQAQALASDQAQLAAPYGGYANAMFRALPNVNLVTNQTGAGSNVQMSFKSPPFNDPVAREAIILALDRKAVATAFQPGTPPQTNLFPRSHRTSTPSTITRRRTKHERSSFSISWRPRASR